METSLTKLSAFMNTHNYPNLIWNNACFKGQGSCIDLILSNRKYYFKPAKSFETGLSDHHHHPVDTMTSLQRCWNVAIQRRSDVAIN